MVVYLSRRLSSSRLDGCSWIGICLLQRRRFASAGACFGYAAIVRIFPILFLFGPFIVAGRDILHGERPRWALRLGAGLFATLILGVAAGCAAGRGPDAWRDFSERIEMYAGYWAPNMVGMDTIVITGPSLISNALRSSEPSSYFSSYTSSLLLEKRVARALASATLLALVVVAMWHASVVESAILGIVVIFALLHPASYYWIMVLVVPLRGRLGAVLALLGLESALHGIQFLYTHGFYLQFCYALHSWGLLLFFAAWLAPPTWRQLIQGAFMKRNRLAGASLPLPEEEDV